MKKENLIIKWLDNNLDAKEQEAFEKLDAYASLTKLDNALQNFKAPDYKTPFQFNTQKLNSKNKTNSFSLYKTITAIAAVFIIALSIYFIFPNETPTTVIAQNGTTQEAILPDNSEILINAGSTISYLDKKWDKKRTIKLEGEAYFKVAKGKTFSVETAGGIVKVLGTEFNVKSRKNYFEVTCFEGLVAVEYQNETFKLTAGNSIGFINGTLKKEKVSEISPNWSNYRSVFQSVPYFQVIEELERQYNIKIEYPSTLTNPFFTGSFTHKNIESALQAITIPLNLSYEITGNKVKLKPFVQ